MSLCSLQKLLVSARLLCLLHLVPDCRWGQVCSRQGCRVAVSNQGNPTYRARAVCRDSPPRSRCHLDVLVYGAATHSLSSFRHGVHAGRCGRQQAQPASHCPPSVDGTHFSTPSRTLSSLSPGPACAGVCSYCLRFTSTAARRTRVHQQKFVDSMFWLLFASQHATVIQSKPACPRTIPYTVASVSIRFTAACRVWTAVLP